MRTLNLFILKCNLDLAKWLYLYKKAGAGHQLSLLQLIVNCCIVETESCLLHLGACPNVKKRRRRRAILMTTTEASRLQLDILQQEREARNLELSDNPSRAF